MTSDHGSRTGNQGGAPDDMPACRWQESLALHALGSLSTTEIPGLIEHLATGCPACNVERARLEETLAIMDVCEAQDAATVPTPSASLRARLMQSVAASAPRQVDRNWQHWKAAPGQSFGKGLFTVHAGAQGFERTHFEGIEVKPLYVDAATRRVTMLVRMAPGTSYPAHRHATSEECFVVSGEIKVGDRTLSAGDYQVAAQGSLHGVQSTEKGCVLFIVSSQDDELV
jgi:anti-sigma factor ChrR (cupin superfamily)